MMKVRSEYKELPAIKADALILFIPSDDKNLNAARKKIHTLLGNSNIPLLLDDVRGKIGDTHILYTPETFATRRLLLSGIGETSALSLEHVRRASAVAAKTAQRMKLSSVAYVLHAFEDGSIELSGTIGDIACAITEGAILGTYRFSSYFTDAEQATSSLKSVTIISPSPSRLKEVRTGAERARTVCEGTYLARDLGNTPGIDLYPSTLARIARNECRNAGCRVTVFDEKKIASLKMGGLLAVSRGSEKPPRFIIVQWNGGKRTDNPYVLIGKGITFDTGGISLKPAANMGEMKMDMSGAAAVIGTLKVAALLGLPVNIVGLIPACENMPSGSAIRPGDIIRMMNGTTVEVDNTDAEGRLILADALVYAKRYNPKAVVDLATLTGACVVALGHYATGMMGNDSGIIEALRKAGERTYERVWELPLFDEYEQLLKSNVADLKNVGGRWAGAITAGWFLKKFVKDFPWVHLDIAGTAILEEDSEYTQRGASGVGVRLLIDWLSTVQ